MQAIQPIAYLQAKFARQHCQVMLQSLMRWFSSGNSLSRLDQAFDGFAVEILVGSDTVFLCKPISVIVRQFVRQKG